MPISAKIVTDSISPDKIRLTTMELVYPRFIHDELMTHRAFSRNAASSRAIPVEKMISMVETDPAMPVRWGINGKGMQDHGEMTAFGQKIAKEDWLNARDAAVAQARTMLSRPEQAHKQIINRILAPYMHMTVLVTATDWANFFALRYHKDADPTFEALAHATWDAFAMSVPTLRKRGDWHLPYITDDDIQECVLTAFKQQDHFTEAHLEAVVTMLCCRISGARCARVSYLTHDQKKPTAEEDLALFDRLIKRIPMHASPIEHQATPDHIVGHDAKGQIVWANGERHANFKGWQQYRKFFVGENITAFQPSSASDLQEARVG